ncbi:MAG: RNA 2',3'-cyclic phosphodiesterase [Spirochaetaceae bacterium]|jgi:2'-5' RNA ligase|nr:RNA 2',3'-cyclic phosphodiesterase [Spirochaetaceae bacterium]
MRTFVALELPPEFTRPLYDALVISQERYPGFRWTRKENYHITLAFLGELDDRGVSLLEEAVQETVQNTEPFSIEAGNIIRLPPRGSPRVIALDIEKGKNEIRLLAARFEEILAAIGEKEGCPFRKPETRPYTPHLTLARKGGTALEFPRDERNWSIRAHGMIRKVTVYKSELYREGPRYTALAVFPLGNSTESLHTSPGDKTFRG